MYIGRMRRAWKRLVEDEGMQVALTREDALYQPMWVVGINLIITWLM